MREPLPPDVESLLLAERAAELPASAAESQSRVARRLEVTLGVALGVSATAATASAATASSASASAAAVGKAMALKLIVGAVGAALVGGGAYVALHKNSAPPPPPPHVIAGGVSRHLTPEARPIAAAPTIPTVAPPVHAAHPRPRPDAFASEQAFLEEARAALVGGAPERAVKLLGEERHRFPSGPLNEARESLLVQSLAAAGRAADARAQAVEFRRRFPHSLFQPAVDASLDGR